MNQFLRIAWAFFVRDAQNAVSYRFAFVFGQARSLAQTIALWLPAQLVGQSPLFEDDGGFLAYSITGGAMLSLFMASYGGFASSISAERGVGTLESIFVTRAPLPALLLGGAAWSFFRSMIEVGVNLLVASLVFDLEFRGSLLVALPIVLLTNITFIALGFYSAAFTVLFKRGDPFRVLVGGASALFGGVFYPSDVLPSVFGWLGECLPITHGARALRGVVLRGEPLSTFVHELTVLTIFGLVLLPLGVFLFSWAVRRAKLEGTLFHY